MPIKKSFMQRMMEQQANLEEQTSQRVDENGDKISRSEQNKMDRDRIKEARKRMAEKYGDEYDDNNDEE